MKPKNIALQVVFMIEIAFTKFKIWIYLSGKLSQSTGIFLDFVRTLILCFVYLILEEGSTMRYILARRKELRMNLISKNIF